MCTTYWNDKNVCYDADNFLSFHPKNSFIKHKGILFS